MNCETRGLVEAGIFNCVHVESVWTNVWIINSLEFQFDLIPGNSSAKNQSNEKWVIVLFHTSLTAAVKSKGEMCDESHCFAIRKSHCSREESWNCDMCNIDNHLGTNYSPHFLRFSFFLSCDRVIISQLVSLITIKFCFKNHNFPIEGRRMIHPRFLSPHWLVICSQWQNHLAKPIGNSRTETNLCLTAGVVNKKGRKMSPYALPLETEGKFQIEVNFIIQSNKYQKRIKHLERVESSGKMRRAIIKRRCRLNVIFLLCVQIKKNCRKVYRSGKIHHVLINCQIVRWNQGW